VRTGAKEIRGAKDLFSGKISGELEVTLDAPLPTYHLEKSQLGGSLGGF